MVNLEQDLMLHTQQHTLEFGASMLAMVSCNNIIYLHGHLGAGKTTLVRGFLQACGYTGAVKSPSYTIVESYATKSFLVYHFDLYRISCPEELEFLGIRDYLTESAICFFEWPEHGGDYIPPADIDITLDFKDSGRILRINKIG